MARTIAIGDVHGCDVALDVLLDALELTSSDTVIMLGDLVDRGPGTCQLIDRLISLKTACTLRVIRGNHEEMMLDGLRGGKLLRPWLRYGGEAVLQSYGGKIGDIPVEHIEFLAAAENYVELEHEILVHANLERSTPLKQQSGEWLRWTRMNRDIQPHISGKRIICGHSSQKSGRPWILPEPNVVCIDTNACNGGFLTALDVTTDEVWQSTQSGTLREGLTLRDFE